MKYADWAARADNDLQNLYRWYRRYDDAVAIRITDTIVEKCDWLALNPLTGSRLDKSRRKSLIAGTSHLVIYRAVSDGIKVLRIYHESQNWR